MPAVGVEADAELEGPAVADVGGDVVRLADLLAVEPQLEVARAVALPADLELDAVPRAGRDRRYVAEGARLLLARRADVAVLDARRELVAVEPDERGGHCDCCSQVSSFSWPTGPLGGKGGYEGKGMEERERDDWMHRGDKWIKGSTTPGNGSSALLTIRLLAAEVREVGDELGDVVAPRRELPVVLEPERETVEPRVALLVHVVLDRLRVVAPRVPGGVDLCHLKRRGALVDDVGDLLHRALVLARVRLPARHRARVAEGLRRLHGRRGGAQGAEKTGESVR